MTGSEETEAGALGDQPSGERTGQPSKQDAKAVKRAAKADAKSVRAARAVEKAEAKAVKRAEKKASKAARKAAKRAGAAESAAARKAARRTAKAESKAAKKAVRRAAKAQLRATDVVKSPAAAHAGALLQEAAELLARGAAPVPSGEESEPQLGGPADVEPDAGEPLPSSEAAGPAPEPEAAEPEPEPEAEAAEPEPEPEPEPDAEAAAPEPEAPEPEPEATEPEAPEPEPEAEAEPEPVGPEPQDSDLEAVPEPEPELETPEPEAAVPEPEAEPEPLAAEDIEPGAGSAAAALPASVHVAAAIDVGATSVHLLVGSVDGHRVTPILDESVFLGLGDRVAAAGFLGAEVRAALVADLERYVAAARGLGASSITIVGTEPMRRAEDAAATVREVETRLDQPFHVLDHGEEGLLMLVGATGGSPVAGELLLVDIGGGSSEFVVVGRGSHPVTVGLPLGAARLTRDLVRSDPPSLSEIEALRAAVARIMSQAPDASPSEIVGVGGTASNLLRLLPATAVDRSLTRRRIAVALAMLTVERSSEAAARHLIRPERARLLPAGAIIIDAILERYRADRLRVSETGIREGAILAAVHGGAAWRDGLASMARGWVEPAARS